MHDDKYLSPAPVPIQRERGGCLSLWIVFFVMINVYSSVNFARQGMWLPAAWSAFAVICGMGVWYWQKLAFYGMLLGYAFNIALNIDNNSLQGVMYNLVFAGLTFFLVQQKIEQFK